MGTKEEWKGGHALTQAGLSLKDASPGWKLREQGAE